MDKTFSKYLFGKIWMCKLARNFEFTCQAYFFYPPSPSHPQLYTLFMMFRNHLSKYSRVIPPDETPKQGRNLDRRLLDIPSPSSFGITV
jgi:hypothetical protein